MAGNRGKSFWHYIGPLALLLWLLAVVLTVWEPIVHWLQGEDRYDQEVLREWIQEARVYRTLPELVEEYINLVWEYQAADDSARARKKMRSGSAKYQLYPEVDRARREMEAKQQEIQAHLKTLADPIYTYRKQLPLFPVVYRLELSFQSGLELDAIVWDSESPRQKGQSRKLAQKIPIGRNAFLDMDYHLRVYSSQQALARQEVARWRVFSGWTAIVFTGCVLLGYYFQNRERKQQRQQQLSEQQVYEAERRRLEEELRRQEAERKQQEAERITLELKSQLWANIGIMAGSYAHNIKNLLVRPNDLLSRCLEADGLTNTQGQMLHEVRHTLGTVTERLQQILQTVRRDPTQARRERLDLNQMVEEMRQTWQELAREKWKMGIALELAPGPLWVEGDPSHLQQAMENLLFNARDATFEMRNFLREQARRPGNDEGQRANEGGPESSSDSSIILRGSSLAQRTTSPAEDSAAHQRRQALIAAASWKGEVVLRTRAEKEHAIFEVQDNGIGMTEEVRLRCTEPHFSTKRNNALFAGMSAGMGLGLSFILVILDHHQARMSIESEPLEGTTFRINFRVLKE